MDRNRIWSGYDTMKNENEMIKKPVVLFPINANPPHIGHLLAINTLLDISSRLIIVLYGNGEIVPQDQVKKTLGQIFNRYIEKNKIHIIVNPVNFAKISDIPDKMLEKEAAFTIATTSKHIFANLKSKGYPYLILVQRPSGWKDEYYSIAYMRSIILEQIDNMKQTSARKKYIEKLEE